MAKSWAEFYADYDGIKFFWKFWDFDQNNPVLKFDVFFAIISTCLDNNVPNFGVHGSFLTLNKVSEKDFEISKILQNLGVKSESHESSSNSNSFFSVKNVDQITICIMLSHLAIKNIWNIFCLLYNRLIVLK